MAYPTRIYLTGFMGCGKSTAGPILAESIDYDFVDLDDAIESRHGRRIREIFADEGEAAFRRIEVDVLGEISARERVVVALGGGAVVSERNRALIRERGMLVYLRLTSRELVTRLGRNRANRPLLLDERKRPLSRRDLLQRITELLAVRAPYYESADLIVDVGGMNPGETADAVRRQLERTRTPSQARRKERR